MHGALTKWWWRAPRQAAVYRDAMAYYIFNVIEVGPRGQPASCGAAPGLSVLWSHTAMRLPQETLPCSLAAPEGVFIGRAGWLRRSDGWTPAEDRRPGQLQGLRVN